MKSEFTEDIDNIVAKIKELSVGSVSVNTPPKLKPKKKILTGGRYALDQFKWKQGYINYKRDLKKYPNGKVINYDLVEGEQNLIEILRKNEYKKSWGKLDIYQQKTKVKEYVKSLVDTKLESRFEQALIKELCNLVDHGKIKKTNQVSYDSINSNIITIKCLILFENKSYKIKI